MQPFSALVKTTCTDFSLLLFCMSSDPPAFDAAAQIRQLGLASGVLYREDLRELDLACDVTKSVCFSQPWTW